MDVSVIATVKNEGESLSRMLDSLYRQSRPPDEVVICDGGSSDNTSDILNQYTSILPLKIVAAPGSNISQGRNRAIASAKGPIIAVTDAGVILDSDWLRQLTYPFDQLGAKTVAGWFEADPYSEFEVVMGATVLPGLSDINEDRFLPSSRSAAFLKSEWEAVGGYPEWLDYSEDLIFDLALFERNGPFHFAPKAVVYFQPRKSLQDFARQYYRYARGDGKANLWPKRHAVRYLTYLVVLPTMLKSIWTGRWFGWLGLLLGIGAYSRRPAQRLWPLTKGWPIATRAKAFALIPLLRLVGDLAKMVGYPAGVLWRLRRGRAEG